MNRFVRIRTKRINEWTIFSHVCTYIYVYRLYTVQCMHWNDWYAFYIYMFLLFREPINLVQNVLDWINAFILISSKWANSKGREIKWMKLFCCTINQYGLIIMRNNRLNVGNNNDVDYWLYANNLLSTIIIDIVLEYINK